MAKLFSLMAFCSPIMSLSGQAAVAELECVFEPSKSRGYDMGLISASFRSARVLGETLIVLAGIEQVLCTLVLASHFQDSLSGYSRADVPNAPYHIKRTVLMASHCGIAVGCRNLEQATVRQHMFGGSAKNKRPSCHIFQSQATQSSQAKHRHQLFQCIPMAITGNNFTFPALCGKVHAINPILSMCPGVLLCGLS